MKSFEFLKSSSQEAGTKNQQTFRLSSEDSQASVGLQEKRSKLLIIIVTIIISMIGPQHLNRAPISSGSLWFEDWS